MLSYPFQSGRRTDFKSDPGSALRMLRAVYVAEGESQRLAVPSPQS